MVALALVGALLLVAVAAFVQMPVQTYLRLFALLVLGDANGEFDVIPDLRARVRASDERPA